MYDLAKAWQGSNGQQRLAESTAKHIQASHAAINAKVTSIKVTHAHLIRAFFFFVVLLLLDPVTYQLQAIGIVPKEQRKCHVGDLGPNPHASGAPKNAGANGSKLNDNSTGCKR